ncbi:DUF2381 family protein [Corallococcus praedator]|uniref:DUF2381 family protein n=1 Tax=Corallococcus praedator TaxID=2316724 RepID=A0ABX9Q6Y6_9BACT|nr:MULTISPECIES: DUF2381 family protein [Corallococcus]RKH05117.1 DUF2381 family protein [Corallococcus sp. CA047B]RKH23456.1 DUF2381 family protein [Corallococcus sp. CA031C]RKH92374.1 DUF2381 family protein [Corallococcus praedator]
MPSSSFAVLLGFLFTSGAAVAQAEFPSTVPGARRIELAPDEAPLPSEIAVSPGLSSGFYFDSDLLSDGIELEGRERFSLVDVGQATLRLVPSSRVNPGETFRLVVRFRDGASPVRAFFLLRAHPAKAEPLVEVYRGKRTIETYQQEAREAHAKLLICQGENARLSAEHDAPAGLTGLISTGALDDSGVAGRVVTQDVAQAAGNALEANLVNSYRSRTGVAVELMLMVRSGAQPWSAKGALLRGKAGADLKVLRVWQEQPIPVGEARRVVVEAETTTAAAQGNFSLKLWEEGGPRTVTISNVTFP